MPMLLMVLCKFDIRVFSMLVSADEDRSPMKGEAFMVTAMPALVPGMPGEAVRMTECPGEDMRVRFGESRGLLPCPLLVYA